MAEVRRRWRPSGATLGLAVAIGVILAAATLLEPVRAWHRARTRPAISDAILSADPAERAEAWASLEETWRDAETRAAALAELDGFLEQSFRDGDPPEEPVAELAMRVDRFAPWRWERPVDHDVLVRAVAWAARPSEQPADPALLAFAVERLIELPDSMAFPLAPAAAASLWTRLDAPMQSRLLPRLVSLAPQSRGDLLTRFDLPKDPRAAGLLLLARLSVEQDLESATDRAHDRSHSPPLRDRAAAGLTRLEPLAAIGLLAHLDDDPSAPWATILAPAAADPAVRAALETRAAANDAAARRLLARIDAAANGEPPESEALAAAWDLLSDPGSPPQARRLAALVLVERTGEELPESALANLLDGSLADEDGSVLASVLLAEATGRARGATSWLRSLEDDRKRAGAMLAVLSDGRHGADRAAIARTQDAASDPTVRSLLRTASWSLASPRDFGARDADREFVHRVSHRVSNRGERGELDLDVLAMRLASGDPAAVDALLTMSEDPDDDLPDSIRRWSARQSMRWLLVERFVPTLAASLGAPLGGSRRERSLQADLALVEWWSSRHRLRFDPATRRWVERRESASDRTWPPARIAWATCDPASIAGRSAVHHRTLPRLPMPEPGFHTSLRVLMTPQDTNHQGTVFGGVILSRIDQAAYLEARRHGQHRWVTVSMDRIEFKAPIWTGDIVDFDTRTEATGRSSVTVKVEVFAERYATGDRVAVTEASVKMVAVSAAGKSIDFRDPPTVGAAVRPERTG